MCKSTKNKIFRMVITLIAIGLIAILCSGCNKQIIDLDYTYDTAVCNYGGDKFELKIQKWKDYEGEQIQVKSDGKTYLLSANNCYLIDK